MQEYQRLVPVHSIQHEYNLSGQDYHTIFFLQIIIRVMLKHWYWFKEIFQIQA